MSDYLNVKPPASGVTEQYQISFAITFRDLRRLNPHKLTSINVFGEHVLRTLRPVLQYDDTVGLISLRGLR